MIEQPYRILNMSSVKADASTGPRTDDRTTKARIRDAAIDCFAEHGVAATTARKVASAAGVSPGLVIHHFESMDGLRRECDDHVVSIIGRRKREAMSSGPSFDALAALRSSEFDSLLGYLAAVLVDDSPAVERLVDEMARDAEAYMAEGVVAGNLLPSNDPRSRAVLLTVWNLGALVLHRHLDRMLGVDLTSPGFGTDAASRSYAASVFEIYGDGILTDDFATNLRAALAGATDSDPQSSQPSWDDETTPRAEEKEKT
jgi:AcrR family transcriptional regulator